MQTIINYIKESDDNRKEYSFEYNDKVFYKGWFEEGEVAEFAQGAAAALRISRQHPTVMVYVLDDEGNKKLFRKQQ